MSMKEDPAAIMVFDTARYMIEDGPGIRTNIFFKGCPLRCIWCSNPFGLTQNQQLAYARNKCTGCGACLTVCHFGAISRDEEMKCITDHTLCSVCGACTEICPVHARKVVGQSLPVSDIVRMLEKESAFFRRNGGGVTLSGGEILSQAEGAIALLKAAKEKMIRRAVETSAFGRWKDLEQVLSLVQVAFIDCKHINSEKHRELTGVPNELILENIRKAADFVADRTTQLIIRIPCIPGLNDDSENIAGTARFVASLPGNIQINLLPYHAMGKLKYEMIGNTYTLSELEPPSKSTMKELLDIVTKEGIECHIGGGNVRYDYY